MNYDGKIVIGTEIDLRGLQNNLKSLETNIDKSMNNASKSITSAFSVSKFSAINNIITKLMNSITQNLGEAVTRLDTMKNYVNVMGNLSVSEEDANVSIERLTEALKGLPTTLDSAALSVQRLTSANGNVKASTEMFLAMNNAILAGGANAGLQASAIEQLSQAYAKGKPDMMEWRTLMMAMPAQLKQISNVMGYVNAEALGEALRSGKISMNDFMATMVKMNDTSVNGFKSLDEQARNATGGIQTSIINVKTAIARGLANIMDAIGQANIAGFFTNIRKAIDAVVPYIAAFVKLFVTAINVIANFIGKIRSLFGKKQEKENKNTKLSYDAVSTAIGGIGTSADKATGSAQKLKKELKQLAGFDEMNILQDNSSDSGTGGGSSSGGGGGIGDIADLGELGNIDLGLDKINKKMTELGNIAKIVAAAVWGLITAWAAWKISKLLADLGLLKNALSLVQTMGIALFVAGVIVMIASIVDLAKNWDKLDTSQKIAIGSMATLAAGVAGLGAALALGLSGPVGFLVGALVGLVTVIGTAIWKTNQYKDSTYQLKTAKERLKDAQDNLKESMKSYATAVDEADAAEAKLKDLEEKHKISGKELYDAVLDGSLKYEKMNKAQKEVYKAYLDNVNAQKLASEEKQKMNHNLLQEKIKLDEVSGAYLVNKNAMDDNFKKLYQNWKDGKLKSDDFKAHIFNMLNGLDKSHRDTFVKNLPEDIRQAFGPDSKGREHIMAFDDGTELAYKDIREYSKKTKDTVKKDNDEAFGPKEINKSKAFGDATKHTFDDISKTSSTKMKSVKGDINSALDANNYKSKGNTLKNWWNGLINGLASSFNINITGSSSGKKKAAKGAIITYPKLAAGGIINMPGRGVPIGGALAGERGAEGVIPLTDSQQMALLGEAIGRYITVNLTNINQMNGRTITRELKRIQNDDDFSFNR